MNVKRGPDFFSERNRDLDVVQNSVKVVNEYHKTSGGRRGTAIRILSIQKYQLYRLRKNVCTTSGKVCPIRKARRLY